MSDFSRHLHGGPDGLHHHGPAVSAHATVVDKHMNDDTEAHDCFQQSPPALILSGNLGAPRIKQRANSIIGVHPLKNEPLLYWSSSTHPSEIYTNPATYTKTVPFDEDNKPKFFIGKGKETHSATAAEQNSSNQQSAITDYLSTGRRPSFNRQQSISNPNLQKPLSRGNNQDAQQQQHSTTTIVPRLDKLQNYFDSPRHTSYVHNVDKMLATVPSTSRYEIGSVSRRFQPDFSTDICVTSTQSMRRNSSVPLSTSSCVQQHQLSGTPTATTKTNGVISTTGDNAGDKKALATTSVDDRATQSASSIKTSSVASGNSQQQHQMPTKKFSLMNYLQQSDFFSRPMKVSDFDVNALSPSSS